MNEQTAMSVQSRDERTIGMEAARFTFHGKIQCQSFIEFALHRADRLELEITLDNCVSESATFSVRGQEALVDMFEMACSLGPYDCIVLDVERVTLPRTEFSTGVER